MLQMGSPVAGAAVDFVVGAAVAGAAVDFAVGAVVTGAAVDFAVGAAVTGAGVAADSSGIFAKHPLLSMPSFTDANSSLPLLPEPCVNAANAAGRSSDSAGNLLP